MKSLSWTIKKLEKSVLSLNNKYELLSSKYDTIKEKNQKYKDEVADIKQKNKDKIDKYRQKLSALESKRKKQILDYKIKNNNLKQEIYITKSESRLNKNFSTLLLGFIKANWYMIYTGSELQNIEKIYFSMSNILKNGKTDVELYWNLIKVYDIKKAEEISKSLTPITYKLREKIYSIIWDTKFTYLLDISK